jgi:lipopolysaccharide transport system ATP-binding protein
MSEPAIRFEGVGKMYKIYPTRRDNLLDALGLNKLRRGGSQRYSEFWALRGVDLELGRGERLGIIGRNGAGKSTLLKLVTGNLPSTEGTVEVNGDVQALLEIGGGLHPEFTGRENIHASLSVLGLSRGEIEDATADISAFTELGRFLDQPFKSYSQGMQARLALGIATAVQPEILIIDEVLGAGDAYFFAKSTARMHQLLDSGASVLLVSHALEQVMRFCRETIWIDRGRIVMRGSTSDVVKAYEKFIRQLDERRLQAKNRKVQAGDFDAFAREGYTEYLSLSVRGPVEIGEVALLRDGEVEDRIAVGDAQDGDVGQSAYIDLGSGGWEEPLRDDKNTFSRVVPAETAGHAIFHLWFFYPDSRYSATVMYRAPEGPAAVTLNRGSVSTGAAMELPACDEWNTFEVELATQQTERRLEGVGKSRWRGSGALVIDDVRVVGAEDREQSVFTLGDMLTVCVEIGATREGRFPLIPAALVFRADGVVTTRHVGEEIVLDVHEGDRINARLDIGPLMIGNGTYLLSIGLYQHLDLADIEPSSFYDYYDRSFEFTVTGSPSLHNEIVRHPGSWRIETAAQPETTPQAARL